MNTSIVVIICKKIHPKLVRNGVSNDEESTRRYNMFSSTEESTTTRRNMFTYTEESSRSYERFTSTEEPKSRNEFATSESSQKTEKTPIRDDCDDTNRVFKRKTRMNILIC